MGDIIGTGASFLDLDSKQLCTCVRYIWRTQRGRSSTEQTVVPRSVLEARVTLVVLKYVVCVCVCVRACLLAPQKRVIQPR